MIYIYIKCMFGNFLFLIIYLHNIYKKKLLFLVIFIYIYILRNFFILNMLQKFKYLYISKKRKVKLFTKRIVTKNKK